MWRCYCVCVCVFVFLHVFHVGEVSVGTTTALYKGFLLCYRARSQCLCLSSHRSTSRLKLDMYCVQWTVEGMFASSVLYILDKRVLVKKTPLVSPNASATVQSSRPKSDTEQQCNSTGPKEKSHSLQVAPLVLHYPGVVPSLWVSDLST